MRIFWLFLLYGLSGFLLETVYAVLRKGRLSNRKTMLVLPMCPVYGLGGVAVVWLGEALSGSPLVLFAAGALVCGALEYAYAFLCEALLGVKLWDYGAVKGSIHGRTHLLYCVYWGVLSPVVVLWIQPVAQRAIDGLIEVLPRAWFSFVAAVVLADALATAALLYRFGHGGKRMPGCAVARRVR